MRFAVVVACVLCFAGIAGANMTGSFLQMTAPGAIVPGQTYTFTFWVYNGSSDGEYIQDISIAYPDGFTLFQATMGYVPIVPGRPSWDMMIPPVDHTALWLDNNGLPGEVFPTEGTFISIDVTVADVLYGIPLFYCIDGDGTGAEPHQICGCIELSVSPVENESWSSIKALYR